MRFDGCFAEIRTSILAVNASDCQAFSGRSGLRQVFILLLLHYAVSGFWEQMKQIMLLAYVTGWQQYAQFALEIR
jgi:hypothetical protein